MKTIFALIAVAGLATGCATYYSDRGAPGYPEYVETGYYIEPGKLTSTNLPTAWPGLAPTEWPIVDVSTPSGGMHRELQWP